jgi:hypothetical protein
LYFKKLFVCRKNHKNGQIRCIGDKWTWQVALGPSGPVDRCQMVSPNATLAHATSDPWDGIHTASPVLIHIGLIQGMKLSCLGSMGPLSNTWRGQTGLQTALLAEEPTYLPCNHHLGAIHRRWMARWCKGRSADAPYVDGCPPPLLCLQVAPCPLHTIKGALELGGDHHSSIQGIPSSLEALQE